jgi:hypothetical protein
MGTSACELIVILPQGHTKLPDYVKIQNFPKMPLGALFRAATPEILDLLGKFLTYEPRGRISAKDVCPFIPRR